MVIIRSSGNNQYSWNFSCMTLKWECIKHFLEAFGLWSGLGSPSIVSSCLCREISVNTLVRPVVMKTQWKSVTQLFLTLAVNQNRCLDFKKKWMRGPTPNLKSLQVYTVSSRTPIPQALLVPPLVRLTWCPWALHAWY